MEIGVADGENAKNMVRAASQDFPAEKIEYYGFDTFGGNDNSQMKEVRRKLKSLCDKCEARITCFGDLSTEEVAKVTGLNLRMAELAKQRAYSETLIIEGNKRAVALVNSAEIEST